MPMLFTVYITVMLLVLVVTTVDNLSTAAELDLLRTYTNFIVC